MEGDKVTVSEGNGSGLRPEPIAGSEIGVSNHVVKVIEVLAESSRSWEDAVRIALREAARSIRNISSIYIQDMQAVVRDGHVAAWRVNAKVSFVVTDPRTSEASSLNRQPISTIGEQHMRHRNQDQGREGERRPYRDDWDAFPEYEEYGLRGDERREYRGRESYEQQTRGGYGGRSGMWDQRFIPRDIDAPYRNNADEDRRGYQNAGYRQEDDYSRSDYGRGYRNRGEYGAPYSERASYSSSYDERPSYGRGEIQRHYGYGGSEHRGSGNWPARSEDQGRIAAAEYGRSQFKRRTGLGPKGYRRSDERIREDVCDRLSQDWDLDASEVEVTVSNGEVTLTGSIADRDQKFRIEHITDSIGGVADVHNQLRIKRELPLKGGIAPAPTKGGSATSDNRSS